MNKKRKTSPFNPHAHFKWQGNQKGFISLSLDLIASDAFKELSEQEIRLLILCYVQEIKPDQKRPDQFRGETETEFFYLPQSVAVKHGINEKRFSGYMDKLIELGFIDCIQSGKHTKTKSIYRYSSRWHYYGTGKENRPPVHVLTSSLIKKYYQSDLTADQSGTAKDERQQSDRGYMVNSIEYSPHFVGKMNTRKGGTVPLTL